MAKSNQQQASAHNQAGIQAAAQSNFDAAIGHFSKALEADPDFAEAYFNLGTALLEQGQAKQAIQHFEAAYQLDTEMQDLHYRLSLSYLQLHSLEKARQHIDLHLKKNPNHIDALKKKAVILHQQQRIVEAARVFKQLYKLGDTASLFSYSWLMQWLCEWEKVATARKKLDQITAQELAQQTRTTDNPVASLTWTQDHQRNLEVAKSWSQNLTRQIHPQHRYEFQIKDTHQKIKIGYVSSNFDDLTFSTQLIDLMRMHDRDQFDVFGFAIGQQHTNTPQIDIFSTFDTFIDLRGVPSRIAANCIHAQQIDILIDLNGHSQDNRLGIFALRPAPIQMTWLGFTGTTGARFFDFALLDTIVVPPPIAQKYYTEKPLYLPHTFQVVSATHSSSQIPVSRSEAGLPEKGIVFSSLCQSYKVTEDAFRLWLDILERVPKSVLWLLSSYPETEARLRSVARKFEVDPDRLIFAPPVSRQEHLSRFKLCDIALDTLAVNDGNTADFLESGIPIVTLQGQHFASRTTSSMLAAHGVPELITQTPKEYCEVAVDLATNTEKRKKMRQKIRHNIQTEPLFDTLRFTQALEQLLTKVWKQHLQRLTFSTSKS